MKALKTTRRAALIAGAFALTLGGLTAQAESMNTRDIALGLSLAIMEGDWAKVDALLADDFTYESDGRPAIGKQEYIGFMQHALSSAFTDMDMVFVHVVEEGGMVAVDYTNDMTHSGEFLGIPATGKRIHATGQFMRQVQNGQVVAEWQTTNMAGMMAQLTGQ